MRRGRSRDQLIVALDAPDLASATRMARALRGLIRTVKVGSALFTAGGPGAVRRLRAMGFQVMLDLKFFDIPSTVESSCRAAARLGASLVTVHASGGPAMLEAAVRGARAGSRGRRAQVLAVTVLTSEGGAARRRVVALARQALRAGCDGVVASAQEAAALRARFGNRLYLVCPGIRPPTPSGGTRRATGRVHRHGREDQRRIVTPARALAAGADALVVGRPITAAPDPRAAVRQILTEMEGIARC